MKKSFLKVGCIVLVLCLLISVPVFGTETEVLPTEKEYSQPMGGIRCEATVLPAQEVDDRWEMHLFSNGRTLEETLLNGIKSGAEIIDVAQHNLTPEEFKIQYYDFCMLYPELLLDTAWEWEIILNRVNRVKPVFLAPADARPEASALLEMAIDSQVKKIRELYQDPLEQLLYLHDWMARYCAYDEEVYDKSLNEETLTMQDALSFHAYGFFARKTAVCQGYAQVFYAICKELGYEVSYCRNNGHIWNYIKLDGKWYHVDVTWDDPTPDQPNSSIHTYFLCSDTVMQDHSPSQWLTPLEELPECDSTKYETGYMFNFSERKTIVKKDGYYQFNYGEHTFCSEKLWTGKVLPAIPVNGAFWYAYLEKSTDPVSIYISYKDENGILRGGGTLLRSGEAVKSGGKYVIHGYALPVAPKNATTGTIYFRSAGTQKPLGSVVSYSYPVDETQPVFTEQYAYILNARVMRGSFGDVSVQLKMLDMSGAVYEAELADKVTLGNFDQSLGSVIGYEGRNTFGHVKKNFVASVNLQASILDLEAFANGLINRVIGYEGNEQGQVKTIVVDSAPDSGRELAYTKGGRTRYDAASQSFGNEIFVNENTKVFYVAADDGTISYARPTPLASMEKSDATSIDSLVDGENYTVLGFGPDETGAAKVLVLLNKTP